MVVAVDFDGYLFEDNYPNVGKPIWRNINFVKSLQDHGVRLILWTCRDSDPLSLAVRTCKHYGINFVAVNANDPASTWDGPQSCKIYADYYLDDRANPSRRKMLRSIRKI